MEERHPLGKMSRSKRGWSTIGRVSPHEKTPSIVSDGGVLL